MHQHILNPVPRYDPLDVLDRHVHHLLPAAADLMYIQGERGRWV